MTVIRLKVWRRGKVSRDSRYQLYLVGIVVGGRMTESSIGEISDTAILFTIREEVRKGTLTLKLGERVSRGSNERSDRRHCVDKERNLIGE